MARRDDLAMKSNSLTARRGVILLLLIGVLLMGACIMRIGYISVVKGDDYRRKAEAQQLSVETLSAGRGTIYDCNMNILAQSASVWRVYVVPAGFKDTDDDGNKYVNTERREATIKGLARVLEMDENALREKILAADEDSRYLRIKGEVEYDMKEAVLELIDNEKLISCIGLESDTKRYYPNSSLASTIIGFTGDSGDGLYGLEYIYNDTLKGTNGRIVTAKDGVQSELDNAYEDVYEAKPGTNLVLTIDNEIQTILENSLKTALAETGAKNIYGIVMNTKTGALMAVANLPDYDLNAPYDILFPELTAYFEANGTDEEKADPVAAARNEQWKNKSIADFYYPGSVFKVFLVSGALEEGIITPETSYYCTGTITIHDRTIKDFTPTGHGMETPCTLLVNSCNAFAVHVGQLMGVDTYYKYFQAFGFTEKTNVDLAGENTPRVGITYHDPDVSFSYSDLASASFGQSITVTPLQIVTAISAVGNGGKLMQPYVVARQTDGEGNTVAETEPIVKRQVISESTASTVASWMEKVVEDGTGKNAYVAGYHVAGKTGTSEKLGSADGTYIASFAGFAPCDDPEISVVIIIDEPQGANYSGGVIAAPVGGQVLEKTLQYLGIEPAYSDDEVSTLTTPAPNYVGMGIGEAEDALSDTDYTVRVIGSGNAVVAQSPECGRPTSANGVIVLYTETNADREMVTVPDFSGLTVSQANKLAVSRGLNVKLSGNNLSGGSDILAYKQDIAIDTEVEAGSVVTVYFRTTIGVRD